MPTSAVGIFFEVFGSAKAVERNGMNWLILTEQTENPGFRETVPSLSSTLSSPRSPVISWQCLPAGQTLAEAADVAGFIQNASADAVVLSHCLTTVESLQSLAKTAATFSGNEVLWQPKTANSLADFLVQQLGLSLACLLHPLWESGTLIVPGKFFSKLPTPRASLLQQILFWNLPAATVDSCPIDWSEETVFLPPLVPTLSRAGRSQLLLTEQADDWLPTEYSRKSPEFSAIQAGLFLWLDELDLAHAHAQAVEYTGKHRAGDYWHAIVHRREPDPSNSKYWYRQVGSHPVYPALKQQAEALAGAMEQTADSHYQRLWTGSHWEPGLFVDFCSRCSPGSTADLFARRLQAIEMILLLRQTLRDAAGACGITT